MANHPVIAGRYKAQSPVSMVSGAEYRDGVSEDPGMACLAVTGIFLIGRRRFAGRRVFHCRTWKKTISVPVAAQFGPSVWHSTRAGKRQPYLGDRPAGTSPGRRLPARRPDILG